MQNINIPPLGESDDAEFKECHGRFSPQLPKDLWQSICAFSNSHGGRIYLGINNRGQSINLSPEQLDSLQKKVSTLISDETFNCKPKVKMTPHRQYLALDITETEFYNKPLYSTKVGPKQIWIRQGSTNVRASDEEMRSLFAGMSGGGENQPLPGDASKLVDIAKVDDYITRTGLKTISFASLDKKLAKIKALTDGKLNIFGLVAFGNNQTIDDNTNNIYIDFKMFPGVTKVDSASPNQIYSERFEFHGDIVSQFRQAYEYLKTKLPTEGYLNNETGLRENRYILPLEALREALGNAIAHRDYLLQSSCVTIDLFSDRIEITNPGESLVAIQDLEHAPSKSRNPNIMQHLKAYHVTDKTARGIPTIYQAARSRGLLDPKFENLSGCFRATLYFSSPHTTKDRQWVEKIADKYKLKDTQKNALVQMKNFGAISNKQYCEINHMDKRNDDRRARRELNDLKTKGLVKVTGVGPGTRYILADKLK